MLVNTPLEQFEIIELILGQSNVSLASIFMLIGLVFIILGATNEKTIVTKNTWNKIIYELIYTFYALTRNQIKHSNNNYSYFGLISCLFVCILFINLLGLIPYSFTITSHIVINLGLSIPLFILLIFTGISQYKLNILTLFLPSGAPAPLLPLITFIEFISFISRPLSLTIRLTANMLAGHTLLHLFASATWFIICSSLFIFSFIPYIALVAFTILELGVAIIQSYIFVLLSAIYLNDIHELANLS